MHTNMTRGSETCIIIPEIVIHLRLERTSLVVHASFLRTARGGGLKNKENPVLLHRLLQHVACILSFQHACQTPKDVFGKTENRRSRIWLTCRNVKLRKKTNGEKANELKQQITVNNTRSKIASLDLLPLFCAWPLSRGISHNPPNTPCWDCLYGYKVTN